MKITAELLASKNACEDQLAKFQSLFPAGIIPTEELCRKYANDFDWKWAAENLLSDNGYQAYEEATATAWKAYEKATAPALKVYQKATATASKAYEEAISPALKAYKEATATAWKAYEEATASAWFNLWNEENIKKGNNHI